VREDYFCPICGTNEWVSYSNQTGIPNGNNLQLVCVPAQIQKADITVTVQLTETWRVENHKPVYKEYSNSTKTLVTKSGNVWGNGMTWVEIDVAAARAGSLRFEIAQSNPANTAIGYFYNVTIVGDEITVYFDNNLTYANFGFEVKNTAGALVGGPQNIDHVATSSRTLPLPANYGETVYLFFHNDGGIKWLSNEIIGCTLDSVDSGIRAFTRGSGHYMVLNNNNQSVGPNDLPLGTYTVILYVDWVEVGRETVVLDTNGQVYNVNFGDISMGQAPCVVNCVFTGCPGCSDGC
jgi:hypothetical protein